MTIARSHTLLRRGRQSRASRSASSSPCSSLTALLVAAAPPPSSQAEEEGGAIPVGEFRLLEPVENMLSASSWVMATGQDPRLLDIPTGGSARGVDWTGYGVVPGGSRSGAAMAPQVPFRSAAPAFSRNQILTRQLGLFPSTPSRTSRSIRSIRSTWWSASSTTTSRPCRRTSRLTAAKPGKVPINCAISRKISAPRAIRWWPSTGTATSTWPRSRSGSKSSGLAPWFRRPRSPVSWSPSPKTTV